MRSIKGFTEVGTLRFHDTAGRSSVHGLAYRFVKRGIDLAVCFALLPIPDFKITNDPCITRGGRFLRKTSHDELPQIFNVRRGDMTLVGPRPTSFKASTYSLWHTTRLELKPGLTSLWQVGKRNELDFDLHARLDIAYLRPMPPARARACTGRSTSGSSGWKA